MESSAKKLRAFELCHRTAHLPLQLRLVAQDFVGRLRGRQHRRRLPGILLACLLIPAPPQRVLKTTDQPKTGDGEPQKCTRGTKGLDCRKRRIHPLGERIAGAIQPLSPSFWAFCAFSWLIPLPVLGSTDPGKPACRSFDARAARDQAIRNPPPVSAGSPPVASPISPAWCRSSRRTPLPSEDWSMEWVGSPRALHLIHRQRFIDDECPPLGASDDVGQPESAPHRPRCEKENDTGSDEG